MSHVEDSGTGLMTDARCMATIMMATRFRQPGLHHHHGRLCGRSCGRSTAQYSTVQWAIDCTAAMVTPRDTAPGVRRTVPAAKASMPNHPARLARRICHEDDTKLTRQSAGRSKYLLLPWASLRAPAFRLEADEPSGVLHRCVSDIFLDDSVLRGRGIE